MVSRQELDSKLHSRVTSCKLQDCRESVAGHPKKLNLSKRCKRSKQGCRSELGTKMVRTQLLLLALTTQTMAELVKMRELEQE